MKLEAKCHGLPYVLIASCIARSYPYYITFSLMWTQVVPCDTKTTILVIARFKISEVTFGLCNSKEAQSSSVLQQGMEVIQCLSERGVTRLGTTFWNIKPAGILYRVIRIKGRHTAISIQPFGDSIFNISQTSSSLCREIATTVPKLS